MESYEILRQGDCYDNQPTFMDPQATSEAQAICESCPLLETCAENAGKIILSMEFQRDSRVVAGHYYRWNTGEKTPLGDRLATASEDPAELLRGLRASVQGDKLPQRMPNEVKSLADQAVEVYVRTNPAKPNHPQSFADIHEGWKVIMRGLQASGRQGIQLYQAYPERFQAMAKIYLEDIRSIRSLGIQRRVADIALFNEPGHVSRLLHHHSKNNNMSLSDARILIQLNDRDLDNAFKEYVLHRDLLGKLFKDNPYATALIIRKACVHNTAFGDRYRAVERNTRMISDATKPIPRKRLVRPPEPTGPSTLQSSEQKIDTSLKRLRVLLQVRNGKQNLQRTIPSYEDGALLDRLARLSTIDREVLGRTLGIDWLCTDDTVDDDSLCESLGTETLWAYVHQEVIPHLHSIE